jgi:hypothetical protein
MRASIAAEASKALGLGLAAAGALGWKAERDRCNALADLRWKRMEAVLNRGRGMAAANAVFGGMASDIYGALADQAGNAARGYFEFLAYSRERLRTRQPPGFKRPRLAEDYVRDWWGRLNAPSKARSKYTALPDASVEIGEMEVTGGF